MSDKTKRGRAPSEGTIRRARVARTCSECGWRKISPGEQYLYAACPPWHDANSTRPRRWWIIAACLRCADHYRLHNSVTRAALAAETGGGE